MSYQAPIPAIQFDLSPSAILTEAKQLVLNATKIWDQIAQISTEDATFANVILPILHEENERVSRVRIISFFDNVSPNAALRDAATEVKSIVDRANVERWTREDVFRLVEIVHQNAEGLDSNEKLVVKLFRDEFVKNGLALQDAGQRERLKEITVRLRDIAREYRANIDHDTRGLWFTLEELRGVSATNTDKWKTSEDGSKRFVNFKRPSVRAVLQSAERGDIRRRYWTESENRLKDANGPLHREMLLLRDERARLLGYEHHAQSREDSRMLSTETASEFLQKLGVSLKEVGRTQMDELKKLKAAHLGESNPTQQDDADIIYHWDVQFYQSRQKARDFKLDQDLVAEYFPYEAVMPRIMAMLELFFGIKFHKLPPGTSTWHPDVVVYTVWDEEQAGGGFLGYLYLDVFPRDFKHAHRSHYGLQKAFIKADGTKTLPSSVLLTNFPPPSPTKPSLLPYAEVVSCFHELTHAVHNLVHHTTPTGAAPVWRSAELLPRDYIELPCRTVEHLFGNAAVLRCLSAHCVDGARIPRELADAVVASRVQAPDALAALATLYVSSYDLAVHAPQSRGALEGVDLGQLAGRLRRDITMRRGEEGTYGHTHLRLIICGAYDSTYYTYLLADAYSHDIFESMFRPLMANIEADTLEEAMDESLRAEGRRFRKTMLEAGDSTASYMGLVKDFLRRDANVDSFIQAFQVG